MSEEIQIGNKTFMIPVTIKDNARRRLYFMNPGNPDYSLTDDERNVLTAIGVDSIMEDTLRPYLAKFFETLPRCKTDAAMYLSKQCEIPYYVLWSIKFANRQETTRRIEERTLRPQTNLAQAETDAYVSDLKERKPSSLDYLKMFTLLKRIPATTLPTAPPMSVSASDEYTRIFTLIPLT
jgi:hypothetical protein